MGVIDPRLPLASVLRAQLAGVRERARARPGAEAGRPSKDTATAVMAQRLAAIAPEDPDRRQKAVRIYLESELAREFGAGLLNDPAFPRMVDAVQQQMQDDAQTAAAMQALGDLLLAGPGGDA